MNTNNVIERRSAIFWRKHSILHTIVGIASMFVICLSSCLDVLFIACLAGSFLMDIPLGQGAICLTIGATVICIVSMTLCIELNLFVPDDNHDNDDLE